MDRGAWPAAVPGVVKSQTRLSTDRMTSSPPTLRAVYCFDFGSGRLVVSNYRDQPLPLGQELPGEAQSTSYLLAGSPGQGQEFQASPCATFVSKWELAWRLPVFLVIVCNCILCIFDRRQRDLNSLQLEELGGR